MQRSSRRLTLRSAALTVINYSRLLVSLPPVGKLETKSTETQAYGLQTINKTNASRLENATERPIPAGSFRKSTTVSVARPIRIGSLTAGGQ